MSFKIIWSDFEECQLDKIYEYYIENVSIKVARNNLHSILNSPYKLIKKVEIFQIKYFLLDTEVKYRYVI